jgi:hypothetical protein
MARTAGPPDQSAREARSDTCTGSRLRCSGQQRRATQA